jgi:hypothetical protein
VVLLDQDRVVEAHAVIGPAAGGDRRLLQGAQARGGLARVEDAGAGELHPGNESRGQRGHTGEVAEEVERRPLGREQRPCRAGGARDDRRKVVPPLPLLRPILQLSGAGLTKDLGGDIQAEEHTRLLLGDRRPPRCVLRDDRFRRDVARAQVLEQGAGD